LSGAKTITITGGDSLEAFTTAHTREDGGTNMNNVVYDGTTYLCRLTTLATRPLSRLRPLSLTLVAIRILLRWILSSVRKVLQSSSKAREILAAIKKGTLPESNNNDGAGTPSFKIITLDYLTSDAQWFMFDSSRALTDQQGFQFIESEGNNVDPVNVVL